MAGTGRKTLANYSSYRESDKPLTAESLATSFGYMTVEEVRMLKYAVGLIEPGTTTKIVNVGAGAGTSSLAIREASLWALLYSIDISPGGPLGGFDGETNAFKQAFLHPTHHPIQMLGDSGEIAANWQSGPVDMVFIDDGHHYDDISRDIKSWWPILKTGGIIAFHDYGAAVWPDVAMAVDELVINASVLCQVHTFKAFRKLGE